MLPADVMLWSRLRTAHLGPKMHTAACSAVVCMHNLQRVLSLTPFLPLVQAAGGGRVLCQPLLWADSGWQEGCCVSGVALFRPVSELLPDTKMQSRLHPWHQQSL